MMTRPGVAALFLLAALMGPASLRAEDTARVDRIQGSAQAVEPAGSRSLAVGDPIHRGDHLRTGAGSRLHVRFADGMDLTLGEGAEMVVEDFTWLPATAQGNAALGLIQGAFLLESGQVGKLPDHPLVVKTPLASVGVRGTRFWGGPLDAPLNVLLLEGRVVVTSPGGSVELTPGQGTGIAAAGAAPMPPSAWEGERVARAFATVSFEK